MTKPKQKANPRRAARPKLARLGHALDVGATAHYDDAAYYAKAYRSRRHDVDYYVALAQKSGGPVLECGVGNGRVALAIARAGIDLVGLDVSRPMLSDLQAQLDKAAPAVKKRVKLQHADLRAVRLRRRFPLVIAPFNVVLHLYRQQDMEQFLARAREHLLPHGKLVFDFSSPHLPTLMLDPNKKFGSPRFRHPTRGLVKYAERFEYDTQRQILLSRMEFTPLDGSPSWEVPLVQRQFFPQEMAALLHYNGFTEQVWTEDFTDRPASPNADSLVVSCSVKSKPRARSR